MADENLNVMQTEYSPEVEIEEVVELVEVIEASEVDIEIDSMFPAYGEPNEALKHSLLNDRDLHDQHPISAITGLRDELDEIQALGIVYSNEENHANYYMWQDENPLQEDRGGFFVTLCDDAHTIKVCEINDESGKVDDIFGVTVESAAFIGNQDDIIRDYKYGLVVNAGVVAVRCESQVAIDDYVVANRHGVAQKTNHGYGYRVIDVQDYKDTIYAVIALSTGADKLSDLKNDVMDIDQRTKEVETNVVAAVSLAGQAYSLAKEVQDIKEVAEELLEESKQNVEKNEIIIGDIRVEVEGAVSSATQAKAEAEAAATTAESMRKETVDKVNATVADLDDLTDKLKPILEWTDGTNVGAEYLVQEMGTKTEISTVENNLEKSMLATTRNAKHVQNLLSNIAKYSVGEYSQAYGLSFDDAVSVLAPGYIYVPTVAHKEIYSGDESDYTREFSPSYYYVWDGTKWASSGVPSVWLSPTYVTGNEEKCYWYNTSEVDIIHEETGNIYEAETLYEWIDDDWIAVATYKANSMSRMVNLVRQTVDSYGVEIVNARGGLASLDARMTTDEAKINTLTAWSEETETHLASIQQQADANGASIQLLVADTDDGNKQINAANIIAAINDEGSSVRISANKINLSGYVTMSSLTSSGTTTIDGSRITTGTITFGSNKGGFCVGNGNDGYDITCGPMMYGAGGLPQFTEGIWSGGGEQYIIVTQTGARMTCGNYSCYVATSGSGDYFYAGMDDGNTGIRMVNKEITFKNQSYEITLSEILNRITALENNQGGNSGNEPHTHSYIGNVIEEATCTSSGVIEYTCSCGVSYQETIPMLAHAWTLNGEHQPADHVSNRADSYTCSVCGAFEIREVEGTAGHQWVYEGEYIPATCTTNRYDRYTCSVNGCDEFDIREIPDTALGHTDSYYNMQMACDRCGATP